MSMYIPEHQVLEELRKEKVPRIPTVLRAWDVAPYGKCYDTIFDTVFAEFNKDSYNSKILKFVSSARRILRPYRLITKEIAQDLSGFANWKQVSVVMRDALGGTLIVQFLGH